MKGIVLGLLALAFALPAEAQVKVNQIFYTKDKMAELFTANRVMDFRAGTKLEYYGGPVLSKVKLYAVMWNKNVDSEIQSKIGRFFTSLADSEYMDMLNQYSTTITSAQGKPGTNQTIGRGTFGGIFIIQPNNASTDLQDADVGAELEAQIMAGNLPKPDADSLYMIYFPPGVSISLQGATSCKAFCGYHHSTMTRSLGQVYFSVIPDLGGACSYGCGFGNSPFENVTIVSSHEIAEGITDPAVDPNGDFGPPIAWVTNRGEEIGDVCASEFTRLTAPDGMVFTVQQEFDNKLGSCNPGPFRSSR